MASYQVKVEYGGKRFATFLLENVSYVGLLSSIKRSCSSLSHLDEEQIRLRYKDEDGDMINMSRDDEFTFTEMLRTAHEVQDRDYKKILIQAHEIDSPVSQKRRRLNGSQNETPSTSGDIVIQRKQLSFPQPHSSAANIPVRGQTGHSEHTQQAHSPLDSKQQELNGNLAVLRVQVATAKEELQRLNERYRNYMPLAHLRARICTLCHGSGHTKTTCRNPPCTDIDKCKIKEKHPEHKAKIQELQREIKSLESQVTNEEANLKTLESARERAKTSFFSVMRPRLRAQNLLKYATGKRIQLDRDLLILQRALNNKIPEWSETEDWKLPVIIEQFQNCQLKALIPPNAFL